MSDEDKTTSRILAQDGMENYTKTVTIKDINWDEDDNIEDVHEVQRNLKNHKLKSISAYLDGEFWIFPTSVLLWTKSNDFLTIEENGGGLYDIDVNEAKKWQEWFFIIDGQHRIFWLLNHLLKKLMEEFGIGLKKDFDNNFDPVVNEINFILDKIWEDKKNEFMNSNNFDLPVVIINELVENKMALLFADINSNSTKLDSNLETWIYGKTDETKKHIRIFVQIWEKLNSNPSSPLNGRFKTPTNLNANNLSKIWIKPFCDNSLNLLKTDKEGRRYLYSNKPFNLLFDELSKYEDEISDETVDFMINWLTIIYFVVFNKSRILFWVDNHGNEDYGFINTNNLGLYLYIIKIVTCRLYNLNRDNFLKIFYDNKIIGQIDEIFDNQINDPLSETYREYNFFKKWEFGGSSASKEAEIVKFFKTKYFGISEKIDKKEFREILVQKETELVPMDD